MTDKARGGRGLKSENKYERFTVTVPPAVLELLDQYAETRQVSRSEAFVMIVERHEKMWPQRNKKQV